MESDERPTVEDVYDDIAESYAEGYWEHNPWQANFEFPRTPALIPTVSGKRVLDAGCGSGVYTEWLLDRGADVVAVDVSGEMLTQTAKQVGGRAELHQADLGTPLDFASDDEFEGIVSGSVLDHMEDWHQPFTEFTRVLSSGGFLVFSIRHPLQNYLEYDDWSYFEVESRIEDWGVEVPHYLRPLSEIVNPLLDAGFQIDELAEPQPTGAFKEKQPEEYETLLQKPHWLSLRALKP